MSKIKFYKEQNLPLEMHKVRIIQKLNLLTIDERLKAIQNELGDKAKKESDIDELREQIKKANMPKNVEEKALKDEIYANNLKLSGYTTQELVDAYETLITKRTVYAKQLYAEYMKSNDYTADEYYEAYKELNKIKNGTNRIYSTCTVIIL